MEKGSKVGKSVFKVVGKESLEAETRSGWRLHQVLSESEGQTLSETGHVAPSYQGGSPQQVYNSRAVVVERTMFLLRYDGDQLLSDMQLKVFEANGVVRKLEEEIAKAAEELLAKDAELSRMKQKEEAYRSDLSLERGRTDQARQANLRYEKDIAKLRQAIGDLRMKEILE